MRGRSGGFVFSGVGCVAVGLGSWEITIRVSLVSERGCLKLDIPSAASCCSVPSLGGSEMLSSITSAALAPLSCCKCSISAPEVVGLDEATLVPSAIVGLDWAIMMEMVGESSVRMRVNTRFLLQSDAS